MHRSIMKLSTIAFLALLSCSAAYEQEDLFALLNESSGDGVSISKEKTQQICFGDGELSADYHNAVQECMEELMGSMEEEAGGDVGYGDGEDGGKPYGEGENRYGDADMEQPMGMGDFIGKMTLKMCSLKKILWLNHDGSLNEAKIHEDMCTTPVGMEFAKKAEANGISPIDVCIVASAQAGVDNVAEMAQKMQNYEFVTPAMASRALAVSDRKKKDKKKKDKKKNKRKDKKNKRRTSESESKESKESKESGSKESGSKSSGSEEIMTTTTAPTEMSTTATTAAATEEATTPQPMRLLLTKEEELRMVKNLVMFGCLDQQIHDSCGSLIEDSLDETDKE